MLTRFNATIPACQREELHGNAAALLQVDVADHDQTPKHDLLAPDPAVVLAGEWSGLDAGIDTPDKKQGYCQQ